MTDKPNFPVGSLGKERGQVMFLPGNPSPWTTLTRDAPGVTDRLLLSEWRMPRIPAQRANRCESLNQNLN